MEKFKRWFVGQLSAVGTAMTAFPAVAVFLLFACLAGVLRIGNSGGAALLESLIFSSLIGALSNLFLIFLARKRGLGSGWQLAMTGMGILFPSGIFLLLYTLPDESGLWRARVIVLGACFVLGTLLLAYRKERGLSYATTVFLRHLLIGVLFGAAVFLLVGGAAFIVETLGAVAVKADFYIRLCCFCGLIVSLFVLPVFLYLSDPEEEQSGTVYNKTMETAVSYIFIPLMLAFLAVEIVLFARAYIYGNWPTATDIFSRLAAVLGIGCLVYMLAYRYRNGISRFYRIFLPCAGLCMLGVGGWRLGLLIGHYGVTENRYLAVFGYLFLALSLLIILAGMNGKGRIVLMIAMAFSVIIVLPVINYHTVSAYSQVRRAEGIMERNGMLTETGVTAPKSISEEDRLELSRSVQYLCERGETSLAKWLPIHFDFYADYAEFFGVEGEYDENGESTLTALVVSGFLADKYYSVGDRNIILTNNKTYNLYNFSADGIAGRRGSYDVLLSPAAGNSLIAVIKLDGEIIAEQDLTDQLVEIARSLGSSHAATGEAAPMSCEQMTLTVDAGIAEMHIVLKSVTARLDKLDQGLTTALTDIIWIEE